MVTVVVVAACHTRFAALVNPDLSGWVSLAHYCVDSFDLAAAVSSARVYVPSDSQRGYVHGAVLHSLDSLR